MENTNQELQKQDKISHIDRLKRTGAVTLPNLFTLANMALGFFAIIAASNRDFSTAAWFIVGAMIMDMLDGRIARLVKGESRFGIEFDSMADWVSFGLAPAFLLYLFLLKDYGFWGYPVAFIYAFCGATRLARFNLLAHSGTGSKHYFVGLPIPMAAGILSSFVLAYSMLESDATGGAIKVVMNQMPFVYSLIPFIMLALALLMVSNIPYASFKQSNIFRPTSLRGILAAILAVFLMIAYPQDALFLFFTFYVISGLIAVLWRAFRSLSRTNADEPPAAPSPHDGL